MDKETRERLEGRFVECVGRAMDSATVSSNKGVIYAETAKAIALFLNGKTTTAEEYVDNFIESEGK